MLDPEGGRLQPNGITPAMLLDLAARGLPQMLGENGELFCYSLRRTPEGLTRVGHSHRYTIMTLLGLHRLESAGGKSPLEIAPLARRILDDTSWIESAGDLGLLLWLCAVVFPERFLELSRRTAAAQALSRFRDTKQGKTMELAWFLTGLSHGLNVVEGDQELVDAAFAAFRQLCANQGTRGIFGHQSKRSGVAGLLRGRIGSFADQVYPIYALSQFGRFSDEKEALARALECARTICNHQGANGEWWWHYNAGNGGVVETYPVYSVHQDGMAPMALFALSEATGEDFSGFIGKGLSWVSGRNELKCDMRSQTPALIWRNVFLPFTSRLFGRVKRSVPIERLQVNYECRPYELGWALYALSGRS